MPSSESPEAGRMPALPALNASRWATCIIFLINGMTFGSWASRIPSIKESIGLSPSLLGWALLSMGGGAILSMSFMSPLIKKYGSRFLTTWSCLLGLIAFAAISLSHSFEVLICTNLIFGVFIGFMDVSMNTNAVSMEKRIGRPIMSSLHAAWSIGAMLGAAIGSILIVLHWNVQQHFALIAIILGLMGLVGSRLLVDDVKDDEKNPGSDANKGSTPDATHLSIFLLSVLCFCAFLSEGAIADWSSLYMRDVVKSDEGIAALGFSAFSMAMAFGRLTGDAVIVRFKDAGTLLAGGVLSAIGVLLVVAYPQQYLSIGGFFIAGLGFSVQVPITFRLAGYSTAKSSADAIAIVARAGYFGLLAGPSLFGYLAEWFGLRSSLTTLLLFGFCTISIALYVVRSARSDQVSNA